MDMLRDNQQKIRQIEWSPRLIFRSADAAAVVLGLFILILWLPETNSRSTIIVGLVAIGLFGIIADFLGLYRNWRGIPFEREATCTLLAWSGTMIMLAGLGQFAVYSSEISSRGLWLWFAVGPIFSLSFRVGHRLLTRWMVRRGIRIRRFAIVGLNGLGRQLLQSVESSPDLGLKFAGFFDDRDEGRLERGTEEIRLGPISELVLLARRREVQVVFITIKMQGEDRIREIIRLLSDTTASVYIVPDLFVFQLIHSRWSEIQGLPVVSVFENPFYGVDGILKRAFDVVAASGLTTVAAVPMLAIAMLVKLTSPGPILFRQSRYGLDGREIRVWKFRTMTVCEDGEAVKQATKDDQRITWIGKFLRRTSLDELPQLFNVLIGNMSLVGPRPHAKIHNEYYRKEIEGYMLRHKVKPGITGLAQVNGCRGETDTLDKMERRVRFDHQYIREWTIWLDLRILLKTFHVVVSRQNAY
jgi:putative colanic acid biosynthesis UDP-glucose lipid carrier transferase